MCPYWEPREQAERELADMLELWWKLCDRMHAEKEETTDGT